ncbi:MAG: hypothetical protein GYA20_12010 [Chloroflexi bacterium]|nr:hypothetical protein [Chloroflexota bacterium]
MKRTSSIAASLQLNGLLLLVAFFLVFFYTTLHESGHALAGLLAGGSVRQVNVNFFDLSAHAVLDGNFTRAQQALISVSGWALPVLTFMAFLLLSRRSREPLLAALRWVGGACVLGSSLPWVVLPLVYLGGGRPADDVTSFLEYSGLPSLAAALGFAVLVIAGVALIVRSRGRLAELRDWLRSGEPPLNNPATRRTLAVMLLLVAALGGGLALANSGGQAAAAPPGYHLAAEFDLKNASMAGTVLYSFEQADAGPLGIYVLTTGVRTGYLDVTLNGPDGMAFPILHGEDFTATEERSNPAWAELPAGRYELVLRGEPARGTVALYLNP